MLLQLVITLKALNEIALVALFGQGVLYVICGANRDRNAVYGLFRIVTAPVMKSARAIAPRFVVDQHIGFFAVFLLLAIEVALIVAKVYLVLSAVRGRP